MLGSFKGSLTRDFQLFVSFCLRIDSAAIVNIFAPHPVPANESTMKRHNNSSQGVHKNLLNYLRLSKETEGNLFQFGFFGEKLIDLPVELNCLLFTADHPKKIAKRCTYRKAKNATKSIYTLPKNPIYVFPEMKLRGLVPNY